MKTKLTIAVLVALSVTKLEAELVSTAYSAEELAEALALEQGKENTRSTAVEAIQEALALAEQPEPQPEPKAKGLRVPKGKAMTTLSGIKGEGEVITADMVSGGEAQLALLKKKGLLA